MASFGLEVKNEQAHAKIGEIRTRLLVDDFVKNPFESKIILCKEKIYVVCIKPIYPAVPMFLPFPALLWLFFNGHWVGTLGAVISFLMLFLSLWWWDRFYFFLFWLVTKRGVKFVSASEALRRVV